MLEQARERIKEAHVNFIQGDVGNLQMENETFDIVLSMNVLSSY